MSSRSNHEQIVEEYFEHGKSRKQLERDFGMHISTINRILGNYQNDYIKANGTERLRSVKPKDPRSAIERRPLSASHACVGNWVSRYCSEHGINVTSFGFLCTPQISRVMVGKIISGSHDITLCQLQAISKVVGISVNQLMAPYVPTKKEDA